MATTTDEQNRLIDAARRKFLTGNLDATMSARQSETPQDAPARGPVWISRTRLPADDGKDGIIDAVCEVFDRLKTGENCPDGARVDRAGVAAEDVKVEWVGVRKGVGKEAKEPEMGEREKFERLEGERERDVTILYSFGGGFFGGSPIMCRSTTTTLARQTRGRICSVGYRLAPVHPFPAQLIDLFTAYMNLLYPAADAFHSPTPASHIIFAGDSSGGNLSLSLLLVLLELHRSHARRKGINHDSEDVPRIRFRGTPRAIPLPAGLTVASPWLDLTSSLPSFHSIQNDTLVHYPPYISPSFPVDHIWPTNPPRAEPYAPNELLAHPLVSPLAHRDWRRAPPMWLACGGREMYSDSARCVASWAGQQGIRVELEVYEGCPHVWFLLVRALPQTRVLFARWTAACLGMIGDGVFRNAEIHKRTEGENTSKGVLIRQPDCAVQELRMDRQPSVKFEDVVDIMRRSIGVNKFTFTGPREMSNREKALL